MIKNVLFDMGNVLMRWDPALFVRRCGYTGEDAELLRREVYGNVDWVMLDRGVLTDAEAAERIRRRVPERLRDAVGTLVSGWDDEPLQVPGMEDLVRELSEKGCGLYLLTNCGPRHREYWPKFPVSRYFGDRIMRSSDWKLLKPDPAFYEKALDMFSLDRRECVFIDDNPANVEAALRLGLEGLVFFNDAALLRRSLRALGLDFLK
ncbi:MAG: HAD family phosphatase [Oscillospiraceae bacterium]|nr:HAD family phosphatase [Oscillospiraceae bacterium]